MDKIFENSRKSPGFPNVNDRGLSLFGYHADLWYSFSNDEILEYYRFLLESGADPHHMDLDGWKPVHYILSDLDNIEYARATIELLLEYNFDLESTTEMGFNAMDLKMAPFLNYNLLDANSRQICLFLNEELGLEPTII